jgi:hypothetical protein
VATVHNTVATVLSSVRQEVTSVGTQVARYQGHMTLHERQLREECRTLRTEIVTVKSRQDTILTELRIMQQQNQQLMSMMQQQQQALQLVAVVAPQQSIVDGGAADVAVAVAVAVSAGAGGNVGVVGNEERQEERSHTTTATIYAKKQGLNSFGVLKDSAMPRLPNCVKKFPDSWNALVEEWRVNDLESFVRSKTTVWDKVLRLRFSKRLRAMQQLRKFKKRVGIDNDLTMAESMDTERKNRKYTLTTHYDFLVRNDDTIMRRKRTSKEL